MEQIKPTYVTFEQAKLLKTKSFDEECKMCVDDGDVRPLPFNCGNTIHRNSMHPYYSAPEQHIVLEWLRVNHGIWIYIDMTGSEKFYPRYRYIDKNGQHYVGDFKDDNNERFLKDTPQEAISAAFDYILKELI